MGYYTTHHLSVYPGGKIKDSLTTEEWEEIYEIINVLREINENVAWSIDEDGNTNEPSKWYGHNKDMMEFSRKYPEALFQLTGYGEEPEDMWIHYYKNGKAQHCKAKVVFPEYDKSQLK